MQKKLAAWFLFVAFLYLVVGLTVPLLQADPLWRAVLIVSLDVGIGLGAAWFVSYRLTRRIRDLATVTSVISKGDLTRGVDTEGDDETAELARSFQSMVESLLNVVLEVRSTANRIHESAQALSDASEEMNYTTEEIAGAAENIARGAEEQAARVEETTTTTLRLSQSVEEVSDCAGIVHEAALGASERAGAGAEDARQAASSIDHFSEKISTLARAVDGFHTKADQIGKIVTFISNISHQTHLLAINAAIEAVRAGEDGRGFAVVAEEVSRLADDVREFAEQISTISEEITRGSGEVAESIRLSADAADRVRQVVERTASSFEGLVEAVRGTASRAEVINDLTRSQRVAAVEVSSALETISLIASQNAAGTEQASAATRGQTASMQDMARSAYRLTRSSEQLRNLISIFRIE